VVDDVHSFQISTEPSTKPSAKHSPKPSAKETNKLPTQKLAKPPAKQSAKLSAVPYAGLQNDVSQSFLSDSSIPPDLFVAD
jgi:hypothetical protein